MCSRRRPAQTHLVHRPLFSSPGGEAGCKAVSAVSEPDVVLPQRDIVHCRPDIAMTQLVLKSEDITSLSGVVGSERAPKHVRMHTFQSCRLTHTPR